MQEEIREEIKKAITVLKAGGIILYPSDTIWGLGCDATNEVAVEKIFKIKKRVESKSLIILIDNEQKLYKYLKDIPPLAYDLIDNSDQPLTIIYPGAKGLAKNVINQDGSVALRIPLNREEFCVKLIESFGKAVVSTSANISGEKSPASFREIDERILHEVDYIVNLRQQEISGNKPSSIIKLEMNGEFKIIRK